eukprot:2152-Amphidinium_carterae.1
MLGCCDKRLVLSLSSKGHVFHPWSGAAEGHDTGGPSMQSAPCLHFTMELCLALHVQAVFFASMLADSVAVPPKSEAAYDS